MIWFDLTPILSPIAYAVVGGVATRLYMPERMTRDLDIVIAASDSALAHAKLRAGGFTLAGALSLGRGTTWVGPDGREVDVLEGEEAWWPEAIAEAQHNHDAQGLPVLSLRYLVLMKYQAGRSQDLADMARMLGQADEATLAGVRNLFREYLRDELDDLDGLIQLGKLEAE